MNWLAFGFFYFFCVVVVWKANFVVGMKLLISVLFAPILYFLLEKLDL